MQPEEELAVQIQALLAEKLMVRVPSPDTDLLEGGVVDSLTAIQLLMQLEEHFRFKVAMEEVEIADLRSVRSLSRLVARQRQSRAAA